jgi:hypothetical protein
MEVAEWGGGVEGVGVAVGLGVAEGIGVGVAVGLGVAEGVGVAGLQAKSNAPMENKSGPNSSLFILCEWGRNEAFGVPCKGYSKSLHILIILVRGHKRERFTYTVAK